MAQGRWRSVAIVRSYVRDASLFTDNAAAGIGLIRWGSKRWHNETFDRSATGAFMHFVACHRRPRTDAAAGEDQNRLRARRDRALP